MNTTWSLLRFCRARKFNTTKIELMMRKFFDWRDEKDLDRIASIPESHFEKLKSYHEMGRYGVDVYGRPVYIERVGKSDTTSIMKEIDEQMIEDYFIQLYERTVFIELPMASYAANRRIDGTFSILDLKGLNVSKLFDKRFKAFLKFITTISQDYYPELLGKMFIVNAPLLFAGAWSLIKIMIDKKTKNKIELYSGVPLKKLEKYVDRRQLPDFLGGSCEIELRDNHGPWKEPVIESKRLRILFLKDRSPEYAYYYTEEEREAVQKKREEDSVKKSLNQTEYIIEHESSQAIEIKSFTISFSQQKRF